MRTSPGGSAGKILSAVGIKPPLLAQPVSVTSASAAAV
jgi:hypothetical protein